MFSEEKAYQDIAKILVENCPENSIIVKYSFISLISGDKPGEGAFTYEFDYVGDDGEERWFTVPSDVLTGTLTKLAIGVRSAMYDVSGSMWSKMIFFVDLEKKSFKAEFVY